jgi:predicted  nucleic acid-binding Zn-ribbon protein
MISREEFDALKQETEEIKKALARLDHFVATLSKENNDGHESLVRILEQAEKMIETQGTAIETLFTAVGA